MNKILKTTVVLLLSGLLPLSASGEKNDAPPIYLIIEIKILDQKIYAKYVRQVPPIVRKYGGKYLVRGDRITPLAGDWNPERVVVIEFPDRGCLQRWLESPEYQEVAPLREQSASSRAIIVEGGGLPEETGRREGKLP